MLETKVDVDDDGNQIVTYVYKYLSAIQQFDPNKKNQNNPSLNKEDKDFWTKIQELNPEGVSFYI